MQKGGIMLLTYRKSCKYYSKQKLWKLLDCILDFHEYVDE